MWRYGKVELKYQDCFELQSFTMDITETMLSWDLMPTASLADLISQQLADRANAFHNCYCDTDVGKKKESDCRVIENKRVTEVILSSLRTKNAEDLISLMQNYLTEEQTLFDASILHALVMFLIEPTHPVNQKQRVMSVLEDQFLLHPSCAVYMRSLYRSCLLDEFKHTETSSHGNKILEYVLNAIRYVTSNSGSDSRDQNNDECDYVDFQQFQQLNEVAMSQSRTSRRKRRRTSMFGFQAENEVENNTDHRRIYDLYDKNDPSMRKSTEHCLRDLFWVLRFLVLLMEHDLIATLKRKEDIEETLIHKTSFASKDNIGSTPKDSFVDNLIEITKYCSQHNLQDCSSVCFRFFELFANTCAFSASTQNDRFSLIETSAPCRFFADYLRLRLFSQCEKNSDLMMFLGHIRPEWLRYRIVEPLVQKTLMRKLSSMPPDVIVSDIFLVSCHEDHNQNDLLNDTGNTEELNNRVSQIDAKRILSMIFIDSAIKLHGGNEKIKFLPNQKTVSEIEIARRVLNFKYAHKS